MLLLKSLDQRSTKLHTHRRQHTLLANRTIKHKLDSHTTRHTHQFSHGRVTLGITVLDQSAGTGFAGTILVLDFEFVLEHDHVSLFGAVLHLLLESGAEGVEGVVAWGDEVVGEEADPAQAGQDAVALVVVDESGLGGDGPEEVKLLLRGGTDDFLGSLLPGDGGLEEIVLGLAEETNVDEHFNHLRESLVTKGTADNSLCFGDVVSLTVRGGVTVGVSNECVTGVDEVRLSFPHKLGSVNTEFGAVLVEFCGVAEGQKDTAARPGELVSERVVGVLGRGETTAVGEEGDDFAAGVMDFGDCLDCVKVVDTLERRAR